MRLWIIFIFCMNLIVCSAAFAESNPLADKIQQYYSKINGFSANFKQVLEQKESKTQEIRNGRIAFKKPLSISWKTNKPHEEVLIINSKEIWDYLPDEDIVYRYSPALVNDSRSIIQVLTGQAKLTKDFDLKIQGKENNLDKLLLFPKEPSPQMVEAVLWIDGESGQIKKIRVVDFYGNSNEITLSDFKSNPVFSASEFNFSPPKGVEVEDRIDKQIEERTLFN